MSPTTRSYLVGVLVGIVIGITVLTIIQNHPSSARSEMKQAREACEFELPRSEDCVMLFVPRSFVEEILQDAEANEHTPIEETKHEYSL